MAGNGQAGYLGDGGPAISARFFNPIDVAVDRLGNLFIADRGNRAIRKVSGVTGIIETVARDNTCGTRSGETFAGGLDPSSLVADGTGRIFVADQSNNLICLIDASPELKHLAGSGQSSFLGDNNLRTAAALDLPHGALVNVGTGIALSKNNLFIADTLNSRIRRVNLLTGEIVSVAGNGQRGFAGDGGPALEARFDLPEAVAVDHAGNLFISDVGNGRVRRVDAATGNVSSLLDRDTVQRPSGLHLLDEAHLLVVDQTAARVLLLDLETSSVQILTGSGSWDYSGDNGPASDAQLAGPSSIATDRFGNIYIADTYNYRIRRIDRATQIITTVAGTGEFGFSGDGGPAIDAEIGTPKSVAVDQQGNIFFADTSDVLTAAAPGGARVEPRIRMIEAQTGLIRTVAGNGERGFSGDGGPALSAALDYPEGIALDLEGTIFIADSGNDRIRVVRRPPTP